jgi:Zn-finger nucleic acid-binding protein
MQGEGVLGCDCPACHRSMEEVPIAPESKVKVDVCRTCQFVWLDSKEIEGFAPKEAPISAPQLPDEAQEILGKAIIEQTARKAAPEAAADRRQRNLNRVSLLFRLPFGWYSF